ncbi:MAG: MmcQ/YjbR family DNA-binding protein [Anaerolineaceae bacterium]
MDFETLNKHLLNKTGSKMDMPFGQDTLVYKVLGKMYALIAWQEDPLRISLKCDPKKAVALRWKYPAVMPGYHLDKANWNTVVINGSIPDDEIMEMVEESYRLVVANMPKILSNSLKKLLEKENQQKNNSEKDEK